MHPLNPCPPRTDLSGMTGIKDLLLRLLGAALLVFGVGMTIWLTSEVGSIEELFDRTRGKTARALVGLACSIVWGIQLLCRSAGSDEPQREPAEPQRGPLWLYGPPVTPPASPADRPRRM